MPKFLVEFNEERCKGCGLCTIYCPVKIVKIDESRINSKGYTPSIVTDMEKCVGCTSCAMMCPDSVIEVKKNEVM